MIIVDGSGAEVTETRSSNCLKDTQLSAVVVPTTKKNVFVDSTFSVTIIMTTSTTATTLTGRRQTTSVVC